MELRIATCAYPISADPARNETWVRRQMGEARERGAQIAHFPECALSGYVGPDLDSLEGYDWAALRASSERVLEHAARLGIWAVLGSTHPLTPPHRPHNCAYVVNAQGCVEGRYDKRFCAGPDESGGELAHYTPGDHFTVFEVAGVRCGVLICHDYRYPELYRATGGWACRSSSTPSTRAGPRGRSCVRRCASSGSRRAPTDGPPSQG